MIAEQVVSPVAGHLHVELDLSVQAAGMYAVELHGGSHSNFGRVVKQWLGTLSQLVMR